MCTLKNQTLTKIKPLYFTTLKRELKRHIPKKFKGDVYNQLKS